MRTKSWMVAAVALVILGVASTLVGVAVAGARERDAGASTVVVPARADLFAAGLSAVPQLPGGGGVLPPSITFAAGPGKVVMIDSATGTMTAGAAWPKGGPAGYPKATTDIQSLGRISGFAGEGQLFLAGVFLGDGPPTGPLPARLGNKPGATVSPKLNQTFYIGLGQKTDGTPLEYPVPVDATHLYLGIVDAASFHGAPGFYDDNTGSFKVTLHATASDTAPPTATTTGAVTVDGRPFTSGTIRFGAVVDVTAGAAVLKNATGTLTVTGADGLPAAFVLRRGTDRGKPILELQLAKGDFSVCPKRTTSGVARLSAAKVVRQLWADGHGSFRTRGKYASATVRGTRWLTADRCDGTSTRVVRGVVEVRDFPKNKLVTVRPGGSYLAAP
jgi:hypothetical protein